MKGLVKGKDGSLKKTNEADTSLGGERERTRITHIKKKKAGGHHHKF